MNQVSNQPANQTTCALLWADRIPGIGSRTLTRLVSTHGQEVFLRLYRASPDEIGDLLEQAGLPRDPYAGRILRGQQQDPEKALADLRNSGLTAVFYGDLAYPEKLGKIPDPPFALYVKGTLPDPDAPAVAVVGSRESTPHGRETARRFSLELAARGVQIISGMARGIDCVAGTAALDAGGRSFAVLGCGADVCYPRSSMELYQRLPACGGVLSEYPPGTAPAAGLFPRRNRIIAGLSDALLVVEAGRHSGTMITAGAALEQGKDVYAIPGRPEDEASVGCNDLIRQGAGLVTDPAELVEALYGAGDASDALWCLADLRRERARILGRERAEEKTGRARSAFMQEELFADHAKALPPDRTLWSFVLLALSGTPKTQEELLPQVAARAGRNVSRTELARTLSRLVRQGLVREQFGRYRSMLQGEAKEQD